jgi:hypothetical protein
VAQGYPAQLHDLVRLFGSERRAAEFVGVSHSQVAGWMRGGGAREGSVRRIADAGGVVKALRDQGLDDTAVITAVNTNWPELGGRPGDLVRVGRAAEVLAAIELRYAAPEENDVREAEPSLVEALLALAVAAEASAAALNRGRSA